MKSKMLCKACLWKARPVSHKTQLTALNITTVFLQDNMRTSHKKIGFKNTTQNLFEIFKIC